ncbi:MAG: alpha/beta hydrolase [Bacteroidota bacterium]
MVIAILVSMLLCTANCRAQDITAPVSHRAGAIDVGGTTMYYEAYGTGQPILLIHAGIADCRMWDEQVRELSSRYLVLRCDLRGFGRTQRRSDRFSHHRDVATLLDSLGIDKVHLVGASFGGRVAIDFALAYPERTRSLILCAPAISGMIPSRELEAIDSTEDAFLKKGDLEGAAEFSIRTWVLGPSRRPSEVSSNLLQKVKEMQLHNYAIPSPTSAQSIPLEPRAITRLEKIGAPTLILIGDKDVLYFQSLSAIAAERISNAKRIVMPNAAHMISMEKPETFNRILIDFLADK